MPDTERAQNREVVNSFLAALRGGDFEGLLAVLDPDVVVRVDEVGSRPGAPTEVRGAQNWAKDALAFSQFARFAQSVFFDGEVGLVFAPGGRLARVLQFTMTRGKIAQINVVTDPARLRGFALSVLDD